MSKALKIFLFVTVLFVTSGVAHAQQYGIGRFERVQILANDLEDATRGLYLRQERQWPRYRGDVQILRNLYRLHNQAANFQNQVQRNFRDRERINLEFRRLSSTLRETEYFFNRMVGGRGYFYGDLEVVSDLVNDLGRTLYAYGDRYREMDRYDRDRDYDDDDYDYDEDYDYDDDDYDDDYYDDYYDD